MFTIAERKLKIFGHFSSCLSFLLKPKKVSRVAETQMCETKIENRHEITFEIGFSDFGIASTPIGLIPNQSGLALATTKIFPLPPLDSNPCTLVKIDPF